MAFLELNGITIPVKKGGQLTPVEIGDRDFAFNGSPLVDRRGIKRRWQFLTTTMSEADVKLTLAMLQTLGQFWKFNGDLYSTKGVGPAESTGGNVQYRTELGSVGSENVLDYFGEIESKSLQCAHLHEATTNIFTANVRTGTDTEGDTTDWAVQGTSTLTSDTVRAVFGSRSLKVEPAAADSGARTAAVAITFAVPFGVTFYVFAATAITFKARLVGDVTGALGWHTFTAEAGKWKRFGFDDTLGATNNTMQMDIVAASGDDFWVDGVQGQNNTVVDGTIGIAPWVDGNFSANGAKLPLSVVSGAFDLSISAWLKSDFDNAQASGILFRLSNDFIVYRNASSYDLKVAGTGRDSVTFNRTVADVFNDQEWHHVVVVLRGAPVGSEYGIEIWVDGVLADYSAKVAPDWSAFTANPTLGHAGSTLCWNGRVDNLLIVPAAMSSAWVAALYGANLDWSNLPKLTASGDFIPETSISVVPLVVREEYDGRQVSGAWQNNQQRILFELHEF